jgi:asparagine synthase (glutamine-hydrolysing)
MIDSFAGMADRHSTLCYSFRRMRMDFVHYLAGNILPLLDKATMANSVEGRVPLLDHRLAEFAFALPAQINLAGGRPKGLFKRACEGLAPPAVLARRKEGFEAPMRAWALESLGNHIERELTDRAVAPLEELLNLPRLRGMLKDPGARRRSAETLYSLYLFSRWYRTHVEKACA